MSSNNTKNELVLEGIATKRISILISTVLIILSVIGSGCEPKLYNDGTYTGISTSDDKGFVVAELIVEDDKIKSVDLTEYDVLALKKDMNAYEWEPAKEAFKEFPNWFKGRKDADIDVYTGATMSSQKYIMAVSFALEKARKQPGITTDYFDGTFTGRSVVQDELGYGMALVTVIKDKITDVRLLEVTQDYELRDYATYSYTPVIEAKLHLEKSILENNSPQVDAFSGATVSSQKWIEAVSDALKIAKVR